MTSQNDPSLDLDDPGFWSVRPPRALRPQVRLKVIVKGICEGKTYEEIGVRCGVRRRTIYTDRSGLDVKLLSDALLDKQLADIAKLAASQDKKATNQAMFYRDRLLLKLLPRRIEAKHDLGDVVPVIIDRRHRKT